MHRLIVLLVLTSFKTARCSFSYAKFETPDSGRVLYSIKHSGNDFLQEYNQISYPSSTKDVDDNPSQRVIQFENTISNEGKTASQKMGRNDDDLELIKELFRPGRLASTKHCKNRSCLDKNIFNKAGECDGNKPCYLRSKTQIEDTTPENRPKMIRFPEYIPKDSPRLGTRSRELGMSGKLININLFEQSTSPPEIKYITYETVSLVPRNTIF